MDAILTENKRMNVVPMVGPEAAKYIGMNSSIRASTMEERKKAPPPIAAHGRGLTVREEISDALLSILEILKTQHEKDQEQQEELVVVKVSQLRDFLCSKNQNDCCRNGMICDLSILSFVKCCVELGALTFIP
jgi:hypothetical protein